MGGYGGCGDPGLFRLTVNHLDQTSWNEAQLWRRPGVASRKDVCLFFFSQVLIGLTAQYIDV